MKVLIFGLANTGKSYLSSLIKNNTNQTIAYFNADEIRAKYDDWDFSDAGRKRQAQRAVDFGSQDADIILWDFICPFKAAREALGADAVIWMNTNSSSKYGDTDAVFEKPDECDLEITSDMWWSDVATQETLNLVLNLITRT